MDFRKHLVRNIAIGVAGLIVVAVLGVIITVQTDWFRNYVRDTIISSVEESTGGKVDLASFDFDVWSLRAVVTNFVIHGSEPKDAHPFVSIRRAEVDLRLFTTVKRLYDISYLGADRPEVNIMLLPNGKTNIPEPKQKSTSDKSTLETVVDLAVGKFTIDHGLLMFASAKQPIDVRGNNLQAQLTYNLLKKSYDGQISLQPLYVLNGKNTPVNFKVTLPVTLTSDRVDLHNGSITTPLSSVAIDGSIANMKDPKIAAHIRGKLSTWDLANAGDIPIDTKAPGNLQDVNLDANATIDSSNIQIAGLRMSMGATQIEASGTLKDKNGNGNMQFRAGLAMGEIGQLVKLSARPSGMVVVNGNARLDASNHYDVTGNIDGKSLAFTQGKERISNINVASSFHVDPSIVDLKGLRLNAFGGEFLGNASLADSSRYQLSGNLEHFNLQTALRAIGEKLPYDGTLSGPIDAKGDTKAPGTKSIIANAHLTISPGRNGIPVSGKLNARYDGTTDNAVVENSFLALPHSRLTLSGEMGKRLNVALTSSDLHDLLAAVPSQGQPSIVLRNGQADFNGAVTGSLSSPRITGHLMVTRFAVEGRAFDSLAADLNAASNGATISNLLLTRDMMRAQANASIGLRNWSPVPPSPIVVNAAVNNGDVADVMALAGQPGNGYSGAFSLSAQVRGTYGNPTGSATLDAASGTVEGTPFNRVHLQANLADQLVTVPTAYIDAPVGRVNLNAEFRHPRDSFSTGQLHAHVQSTQLNLAQIPRAANLPPASGTASIDADVNGTLNGNAKSTGSAFLLTSVNADVNARSLAMRGVNYGDLTATARTNGQTVNYNLTSDFAGSNIRAVGNTELRPDYPTTADLNIVNLPVERVLTLANENLPARGQLSGTIHFAGTTKDPQGSADVTLARAVVYGEPLDNAHVKISYLANSIQVSEFQVATGPSRITLTARYDHPVNDLKNGRAQFTVATDRVDLSRIRNIQKFRAGLGGAINLNGNGTAEIRSTGTPVLLTSLNANVAATGLAVSGKNYGDLRLTANTSGENRLNFSLNSDIAGSDIQAQGNAMLTADYPVNAQLTFRNVTWSKVSDLLGMGQSGPPTFDAVTDGQVTLRGPVTNENQLNANLGLTRLSLTTLPRPGMGKPITIQNQGTLAVALDHGTVRIQNAHLAGPQTDLQATGSMGITGKDLNLSLNGNADLGVAQNFDRDVYSSGKIVLATTVRGDAAKPVINGQLALQNASFSTTAAPIGVSNANGSIQFNGNTARIQNLSAESGGGKISVTGFASYGDVLRFAIRTNANNVRVRVQQGVSIAATADLRISGTSDNSSVTGNVTIDRVSYAPQSDFGSMLTRSAPPVQSPTTPNPFLDNMKLDLRVRSLPGMTVQTSMAQNLQADADLRVRGTANQPGMTGRLTISEGKLNFFGATYNVNVGTIAFYNPLRIEPILDVSLETQAQGVNVTLQVTGPVDNMKLTYTSDPPLQFQEIVALLASGKTPTSDPTLLANQPAQPQQNFQQMGESAILGQAVANPVSSQLQRVFGVSQLKIDPSFTSGSNTPTATLAMQQRITNNLTFTYTSQISDPNSMLIRMEWAFNPQWSAVATRDQNGIVSLNFFYKKGFR